MRSIDSLIRRSNSLLGSADLSVPHAGQPAKSLSGIAEMRNSRCWTAKTPCCGEFPVVAALDPEARPLLLQMMRSQAFRERAAVRLFEEGLRWAPDAEARRRLLHDRDEERQHYEAVTALWALCADRPRAELDAWAGERASGHEVPHATSWLDIAMAQWLYDRAGLVQLGEVTALSFQPYARLASSVIADEEGHGLHGLVALGQLAATTPRAELEDAFARWLRVALLSFGRSGSPGAARARSLGLRRRDPREVQAAFLRDIQPGMKSLRLAWPSASTLGLELKADVFPPETPTA